MQQTSSLDAPPKKITDRLKPGLRTVWSSGFSRAALPVRLCLGRIYRARVVPGRSGFRLPAIALLLALLCFGCATPGGTSQPDHKFEFSRDTFAFPNELVWEYHYDSKGEWVSNRRNPPAQYAQHCFVLARSTRQFFLNCRFDPSLPKADNKTYSYLIQKVAGSNPRHELSADHKIVIPGYANLREFSEAHEDLLKQNCGGAWQSYFQRGHWRMIFPFSRRQQAGVANSLTEHLTRGDLLVVHVVRFPQLTINHAVVLFDFKSDGDQIVFQMYDPNHPAKPEALTYDRTRTFQMAANDYFPGGRVDVYEVYWKWNY